MQNRDSYVQPHVSQAGSSLKINRCSIFLIQYLNYVCQLNKTRPATFFLQTSISKDIPSSEIE
jgi:hypothetical protein